VILNREKTLLLIKPDAVSRGLVGEIISRIEKKGIEISDMKMLRMDTSLAERLYEPHRGKAFFRELVVFMTSGPCVALSLEGENVLTVVRHLVGATSPIEAQAGTLRGDYSTSVSENVVHASDSPENAARELKLFFDQ
jgi:nucleoside-diphosphate kinase